MPASISKQTLVIAGITVNVFSRPSAVDAPVTVLFLLHGRTRSDADSEPIARGILEEVGRQREESQAQGTQADDLIIVTFDHRNHGARLVDKLANWHWEEDPAKSNVRHAVDMYAIQTGTANDVSFLIDFLPAYLYPNDERTVVRWGVAGVSLGGHSTWITLKNDPRVTFGIPIIGCPDYLTLMSERAAQSKVPVAPPRGAAHGGRAARANPFRGKRVLVLCGKEDTLVPWSASRRFVEELDVGEEGVKEVWVEEGTGHRCSEGMVKRAGEFVWKQALVRGQ
ncbi:hypothetical protein ONZ51_g6024 [Trametes cubensis]|uniref:Alpha/beta-hydrolase n=1 Tax=Trametes cubensis TaxID=1111947 RepID=A0AAD7XBI3_9APHY|nr:hypothetical protein ONZ51_g6024 [Trametes cubensis]